jgi:hypothetical protein
MRLDGVTTVGVWRDLDGPEIRAALRALGMGTIPVVHLESTQVAPAYRVRRVAEQAKPLGLG